jgi:hypothetical protein
VTLGKLHVSDPSVISIVKRACEGDRTYSLSSMTFIENPLPSLLTTIGGLAPPPRPYLIFYADIVDGKMWCGASASDVDRWG